MIPEDELGSVGGTDVLAGLESLTDRGLAYRGAATGGVWKSTNGATTFAPAPEMLRTSDPPCMPPTPTQPTRNASLAPGSPGLPRTLRGTN